MSKFTAMRFFLTLFIVFSWGQALAQGQPSVLDIKTSGQYHWGDGFATDRQQAIDLARQDLVQKMVVTITAEQNLQLVDDGSNSTSTFELRSKSLSRMQLRGLDYIVNERRDKSFQVTAFVTKSEFDQSINDMRTRILTQMSQMFASQQRGNLSSAISQAFEILVQTYFIPVPIVADSVEVQSYLRNQLDAWLRDAEVTIPSVANRSAPGHTELTLEASVRFGPESANDLLLQLNRPGYGEHPVRGGRADVFMDVEPEQPMQPIELKLMPVIPASLDAEMKDLALEIRPSRIVTVPVDFKKVISLDFSATKLLGAGYRFTAQFANLSVFDLQWDFGNGESSTQASPRMEIPNIGPNGQPVTLTVNRSPELTVRKVLMADGTFRTTPVARAEPVILPVANPVPNTIMALDRVSFSQRNHLDPLIRTRNAVAFTDQLERLRQQNVLRYGRSTDVGPIDQSYVAIVDPSDRSVRVILTPVMNGIRYELSSNEAVAPEMMRERYQGMGSIWFSFQ